MFSWKKSTNEQPRTASSSNRSGGVDNMDFSDLLKDPVDATGDGTYDDDMDPDLLKQLQELSTSSASAKAKPKRAVPQQPAIDQMDLDAYARLAQDEDIEVEFDENDLNDPNLLRELSMIGESGPNVIEEPTTITKPLPPTVTEEIPSMSLKKLPMNDSHKTARSLPPNEEALQLMAMGFSQRQAMDALKFSDNDLERATNYLLDTPGPAEEDENLQTSQSNDIQSSTPVNTEYNQLVDTSANMMDNDQYTNPKVSMEPLQPTTEYKRLDGPHTDPDSPTIQKTIPAPTQTTYDNVQYEPERSSKPESTDSKDIGSEWDFEEKYNETDIIILAQYATDYQKAAVAAKRAGDKSSAIDLLRKSKLFTAKKEELKELQSDTTFGEADSHHTNVQAQDISTPPQRVSPSLESLAQKSPAQQSPLQDSQPVEAATQQGKKSPQQPSSDVVDEQRAAEVEQQDKVPAMNSEIPSEGARSPAVAPPTSSNNIRQSSPQPAIAPEHAEIQQLLEALITRQKEYKVAAIHYKEIGNLAVAKEMIRISKDVLQTAVAVKNGQLTSVQTIKNKLPKAPDMELGSGKPRQPQEVNVMDHRGNLPSFEQLQRTLNYQMDICHNLELQSRGNQGPGNNNLGNDFKELAKTFAADLASVKSAESSNGSLPRFHYQNVSYAYRETNSEISSNEMIVHVKKAMQLQSLEASAQNIEAYVQWDLGGWPPESVPQAHLGKGQTPSAAKGGNPDFDFKTSIPIARQNRAFMRYLQRKKATFEVYHKRYSYGLFARPLLLGKVTLEMNSLLHTATAGGVLELLDQNRKKTGGLLHVNICLSEPLLNDDVPVKQEKWLIIDEYNANIYSLLASARLVPQSMANYQPAPASSPQALTPPSIQSPAPSPVVAEQVPKPDQSPPAKIAEENAPPTAPKAEKSEEENELDKAEADLNKYYFKSVDSIVSNMVLENEIGLVNSAIAACHGTVPDDLMDQKQALEIKMNMLVIQVQTGLLTMEQYLANVEARMEQDKKCALIFKRAGRLDLAKKALRRKKIAQEEVEEAKAAMAEQAEEE
ncbi:hypothetical protein INT43_002633 [Umbelopsis isabellina]|uniref:UBA domain-containing protein n=1 Tax=Mortierella isabellina TaxID=91625 RepID=A0A8H7Q6G5_MORIS|nr:hypothetical protein INT43_002633 [Umbelopsis isabellina]